MVGLITKSEGIRRTRQRPFTEARFEKRPCRRTHADQNPSASSAQSASKNSVNPCSSVKSVAKTQSIKNNKLCETKPISEKPKMIVSLVNTMTNNKKQRTMNYQKQSQNKPNQTQFQMVLGISKMRTKTGDEGNRTLIPAMRLRCAPVTPRPLSPW